jgi:hypothetical protein
MPFVNQLMAVHKKRFVSDELNKQKAHVASTWMCSKTIAAKN